MPTVSTFLDSQPRYKALTRRELLKLAALTPLLMSCSSELSSPEVTDFARARLEIIMRQSFIPELDELVSAHAATWAAERNAVVELDITPDWRELYAVAARDPGGPDIAELFGNAAHVYSDRLLDVTELAEEIADVNGEWIDVARNAGMVGGRWRAIPWSYIGHSINYRQDVLDEVGLAAPQTYDEMLDVATRLREAGTPMVGFSMSESAPNDSANLAYSMLWSFGAHEVDETGRQVAIDSVETRQALRYFRQLVEVSDPAAATYDEVNNNEAFLAGNIAMTQNATSIYWRARRDGLDLADDIRHLRYPAGPAGSHQLLEVNSLCVFSDSRNAVAALDWVRSSMRPDRLRERANISLSFFSPPFESYVDDPLMSWNTDDQLQDLATLHVGGHLPGWPGPASQEAALVYDNQSIVRMFRAVGMESVSVDEAVQTASRELSRVYET